MAGFGRIRNHDHLLLELSRDIDTVQIGWVYFSVRVVILKHQLIGTTSLRAQVNDLPRIFDRLPDARRVRAPRLWGYLVVKTDGVFAETECLICICRVSRY